jgi:quercetin dioxygenase-like cupin family protein
MKNIFPHIITELPRADISVLGLHAYLLQCTDHQVLFMSFENDADIPEHSHEAQWGAVLDGEIHLTIDGKSRVYKRGDTYFIPRTVPHRAKIKAGYKDVTVFNQKDRYKPKVTDSAHT